MPNRSRATGAFLAVLILGSVTPLTAQTRAGSLPTWHSRLPAVVPRSLLAPGATPLAPADARSQGHSHTWTGLLIGSLVGVAATGVFLAAFCSDPDTRCGADEVGRAVVFIAVPAAVTGAVIGSLIRTER
jgi:hypothetical protein